MCPPRAVSYRLISAAGADTSVGPYTAADATGYNERVRPSLWLGCVLVAALATFASGPRAAQPTPVLVELFTSEGCSDCPAADVLLQKLIDASPVNGAEIIGLGEHVDYWDRLGWRDRFSSATLTERQRVYAARFNNESIYTPQMVVDGRAEFVGSDAKVARGAIDRAATAPHGVVRIDVAPADANRIAVAVTVRDLPRPDRGDRADVVIGVTESRLRSDVTRGENRGRKLTHSAVVRYLATIAEATDAVASAHADVSLAADWQRDNLDVVAFVQERRGRTILGSALKHLKSATTEVTDPNGGYWFFRHKNAVASVRIRALGGYSSR